MEWVGEVVLTDGVRHLVVMVILAYVALGLLRGVVGAPTGVRVPGVPAPALPFLSVGVGLYGLIVLLALFIGTQATVLGFMAVAGAGLPGSSTLFI